METAEQVSVEDRLTQAEADVKALAQSVEALLGVCGQLKAAQAETLAVLKQLLQRS
jgi:hypothetical protein